MKAIFLDAADTLFQLAEPVGQVYQEIGRRHGLPLPHSEIESRFAVAFREAPTPDYLAYSEGHDCEILWWRKLVQQVTKLPEGETFAHYFDELFAHYEQPQAWRLFDDTLPFLKRAADQYRLAVVSNFDARLHQIITSLGLDSYFEEVICSADAKARKPSREIFQFALQRMQLKSEEVLHIGDSYEADYEGARSAGLKAFHLQRELGDTLFDALTNDSTLVD